MLSCDVLPVGIPPNSGEVNVRIAFAGMFGFTRSWFNNSCPSLAAQ